MAVFEHICCLGRHWIPIVVSETNGGVGTTGLRHDQCLAIPQRPHHFHEARDPRIATSPCLSFVRRLRPRRDSGRTVHTASVPPIRSSTFSSRNSRDTKPVRRPSLLSCK